MTHSLLLQHGRYSRQRNRGEVAKTPQAGPCRFYCHTTPDTGWVRSFMKTHFCLLRNASVGATRVACALGSVARFGDAAERVPTESHFFVGFGSAARQAERPGISLESGWLCSVLAGPFYAGRSKASPARLTLATPTALKAIADPSCAGGSGLQKSKGTRSVCMAAPAVGFTCL